MSRRPLAIGLLLFGIAIIIVVVVWLLSPFFRKNSTAVIQPPPGEDTRVETSSPRPPPSAPLVALNQAGVQERQAQEALRRFAQEFASRVGTYSNADAFGAIRQTYVQT